MQNSWVTSRMTNHLKIGLDTLQKEIKMDTLIILCQSMFINTFLHGNQVSCLNWVPGSHIELQSCEDKAGVLPNYKRMFLRINIEYRRLVLLCI